MTSTTTESGSTTAILDWLATQPSSDLAEEAIQFRRQLDLLATPGIAPTQFHRCIELFYGRALRAGSEVKPRLTESGLPLDRKLHTTTRQIVEAMCTVAGGFLQVVGHVRSGAIRSQSRLIETLASRGLRMLSEAWEIAGLSGGMHVAELWPLSVSLISAAGDEQTPAEASGESAQFAFKRLVALGTLQLERFSQSEIGWICDYLNRIATLLALELKSPSAPDNGWYWIAAVGEDGPQSVTRRPPPTGQQLVFASPAALAKRVTEHLARLEAGQQPFELNLPRIAVGVQPLSLLQRLRDEWTIPIKREQPRRKTQYSVQVCCGIPGIWEIMRGNKPLDGSIQEWQVINESPGGFSILHVAGVAAGLSAGTAIALRRDDEQPWSICVVRWIRSENPSQIELGLQIVSTGSTPVTVGFRGARERPSKMVKALVLPAMPALRHHPAILAPTGTYTSRRFSLVSDLDRIYIAQGRLLSLDMQTANIELFQFEIDPYPI
ncbi:hypothetical protein OPU71_15890 [Niveibacterium sp. 24ML]|uniref:hypothetical protein n=1 Tax=Niveibacterium sp. 24ML TaxID=2985512 RepID=UPI00226E1F54|nr:hypothetical protein [Niveibacterium sp. 24ML]MCX9157608.1 hypothetical protein [Niveibacterium sp. 24ML]